MSKYCRATRKPSIAEETLEGVEMKGIILRRATRIIAIVALLVAAASAAAELEPPPDGVDGLAIAQRAEGNLRSGRTIMQAIRSLPEVSLPVHAITSLGGSDIGNILDFGLLLPLPQPNLWVQLIYIMLEHGGLNPFTIFGSDEHDLVVSLPSQQGDLTGAAVANNFGLSPLDLGIHTFITKEGRVGDALITLLNESVSSASFASTLPRPDPAPIDVCPAASLLAAEEPGGITIVSPTPGSVVEPGFPILVRLEASVALGFQPRSVAASIPWDIARTTTEPYEISLQVPEEAVGQMEIRAHAIDASGNWAYDSVTVSVDVTVALTELRAEPDPVQLTDTVPDFTLQVTGVYADLIERDLSGDGAGTTYASDDPAIATVDAEGVVRPVAIGSTQVTVSNGSLTADVGVEVFALPQDTDGDTVLDPFDNCLYQPNVDQSDLGGVGTPSEPTGAQPDGTGDACQCGDVNGDGRVDVADADLLTDALAGASNLMLAALCNVAEAGGSEPTGSCTDLDRATIVDQLAGGPSGVEQVCAPVLGLVDADADGLPDETLIGDPLDNCPLVRNEFQGDRNGDTIGDACTAACDLNLDGRVDAADALMTRGIVSGRLTPLPDVLGRADVAPASGGPTDQSVTAADLLLILRATAGDPMPVCTP